MALAIGDTAPDFEANTTEGKIRFHDWLGNSWAVLFSHPKDFFIRPQTKCKAVLLYPMSTDRNFDVVQRVFDSLQLTAKHKVATPINWKQGEDVVIARTVSADDAKKQYQQGWKAPKPYLQI